VGVQSVVERAVETTDATFAAKGHDVRTAAVIFVEVPVLVGPHLSACSHPSTSLIHDERNSFTGTDASDFLVEDWSCLSILVRSHGLNDHGTHIFASIALCFHRTFKSRNAPLLFSLVGLLVVRIRVRQLGQRRDGPVVGRYITVVDSLVAYAEHCD